MRAGYSKKGADVAAIRLLGNIRVRNAIDRELAVRRQKYTLDAQQIIEELGRIIRANPKNFVNENGEPRGINELTADEAAAISSFEVENIPDKRTGELRRRTRIKLADKNAALSTLSKILGLQTNRVLLEGSIEFRVKAMTPEERIGHVRQLREKAEREYLPRYLEMMQQAKGSDPVIDATAVQVNGGNGNDEVDEAESDDQPVVGTPAAQPRPSAGLRSELPLNGGDHVDQPRRAAREERSISLVRSMPTRLRLIRCGPAGGDCVGDVHIAQLSPVTSGCAAAPIVSRRRSGLSDVERQRRCRVRRARGAVAVKLTLSAAALDGLVALHWLLASDRTDREKVTDALVKFCRYALIGSQR